MGCAKPRNLKPPHHKNLKRKVEDRMKAIWLQKQTRSNTMENQHKKYADK